MSFSDKNKVNRNHIVTALIILFLVGVDLLTKRLIFQNRPDFGPRLTPILNPGAAWSLQIGVPLLILIAAVVCVALIIIYEKKRISRRAFILIMAGALGNLYDRIIFGGVRDFISISTFPVFNVADVLITCGVLLLALYYRAKSREQRAKG